VTQAKLRHARPEITFKYYQDVDEDDIKAADQLLSLTPPPETEEEHGETKRTEQDSAQFKKSDEDV
jgi:hypothetical protein